MPGRRDVDDQQFTEYADRLMAEMGQPATFNYVRLNMTAKKEAGK